MNWSWSLCKWKTSNVQRKCQGPLQLLSPPFLMASTTKQMRPNRKGGLYYMKFLCGLMAISRHPLLSSTVCHRRCPCHPLSYVVVVCCRRLPPLSIIVVRRGRLPQPLPSLSAAVVVHSHHLPLSFVAADVVCRLPLSSISTVRCHRCRPSSTT